MEDKGKEKVPAGNGEGIPAGHSKPGTFQVIVALFNGLGVGLLLGLLLGLSISPVVSGIIGTISSLLVVMIGLNEKFMSPVKSIRIGSFGFFAVAGILAGIFIRANNSLAPSMKELKQEYLEVGYSEREALNFISMLEFDVVPSEWKGGEPGSYIMLDSATAAGKKRSSNLYSSSVDVGQCYLVESADENMPFSEVKNTFSMAGGTWKELAEELDPALPEKTRVAALLAFRDSFCSYSTQEPVELEHCDKLAKVDMTASLESIKSELGNTEETWKTIIGNIEKRIDPDYQKNILSTAVKVLCYEE